MPFPSNSISSSFFPILSFFIANDAAVKCIYLGAALRALSLPLVPADSPRPRSPLPLVLGAVASRCAVTRLGSQLIMAPARTMPTWVVDHTHMTAATILTVNL